MVVIFKGSLLYAQDCTYIDNNQSVVDCYGIQYILVTKEEAIKANQNAIEVKLMKDENDLLKKKVEALQEVRLVLDETVELQTKEIQYKDEYIVRLMEISEPPWYKSQALNIGIGALAMTLSFFLWEYGRAQ